MVWWRCRPTPAPASNWTGSPRRSPRQVVQQAWLARPATLGQERQLAAGLAAARAAEYGAVLDEATAVRVLTATARAAAVRKLRAQLHRVNRRDYFPPPERAAAAAAVEDLAAEAQRTADEELA